ncbi:DnaJ domain-containing protein [Legionella sp. D16C41]|uniref:DnaJ domain-containing protein n=1 Tax=Legionella sp. D16C41 TaxID=3402688 RepID=UPI003AF72E73
MKSLLDKLKEEWDDYSEKGKTKFLEKALKEYSEATYYEIMGVSESMNETDKTNLKVNYKQIALRFHPDKTANQVYKSSAEELFKLVGNAYDTLSDPVKTQNYRLKQGPKKSTQSSNFSSQGSQHYRSTNNDDPSFNSQQSQSRPQSYTYTTGSDTFVFNNGFTMFSKPPVPDQVYNRDIQEHEKISGESENIVITGNVYGTVKNMGGNITVNGNVYGKLSNMGGNNIVRGNVAANGKVSNMGGNNIITGDALGSVTNAGGINQVGGTKGPNVKKAQPTATFFSTSGANVFTNIGTSFNFDGNTFDFS